MWTNVARFAVASLLTGMVITALQGTATAPAADGDDVHSAIFDYHTVTPIVAPTAV